MSNHVGRNDPCPCGSGRKFKKCHGAVGQPGFGMHTGPMPPEVRRQLETLQAQEMQRQQQQGLGKPIISTEFQGNRVVAVGNRVFWSKKWKTFHDFLFAYIAKVFGEQWFAAEVKKPTSERHPLLKWYESAMRHMRQFQTQAEVGQVFSAPTTGAVNAYLGLAYNLYLVAHNVKLQEVLVNRLKNRDQFYGAYYEAFVAGALIRAGFNLEFEDERDSSTSHCELTATFSKTGRKFSVEAKMRGPNKKSADIGRQLHGALRKRAEHTRIIFIEENLPLDAGEERAMELLTAVLYSLRSREERLTIDGEPAPPAYVVVTNNPHDYDLDGEVPPWAVAEGFRIPDFKVDSRFTSLREVITAREKHIEAFSLMRSLAEHGRIPCTFDGDVPELAFGEGPPRLVVGQKYAIPDRDGNVVEGELMDAVVMEAQGLAMGFYRAADGRVVMAQCPLTEAELAAYRQHPETFFGNVKKHAREGIRDALGLYDFLYEGYRATPKERLLQLMKDAPDIEYLATLTQPEIVSIYAERLVNTELQLRLIRERKESGESDDR